MKLRDNFKQAAKELMDVPFRAQDSEPAPDPASTYVPEFVPEFTAEEAKESKETKETKEAQEAGEMRFQDTPQILSEHENFESSLVPLRPECTTIIAAGTIVRGSIESDCDVEMYGEIQGDIFTAKDVKLKGKIRGNVTGGNVDLHSIRMVGNVISSGNATLDADSEVEGDVIAESAVLNGNIRGNVQVAKRLSLASNAVICGYVSANKLIVEEGAVIHGEILIGKNMISPKSAVGTKAESGGSAS